MNVITLVWIALHCIRVSFTHCYTSAAYITTKCKVRKTFLFKKVIVKSQFSYLLQPGKKNFFLLFLIRHKCLHISKIGLITIMCSQDYPTFLYLLLEDIIKRDFA